MTERELRASRRLVIPCPQRARRATNKLTDADRPKIAGYLEVKGFRGDRVKCPICREVDWSVSTHCSPSSV